MKKNKFTWLFASSALLALSLTANTVKADTTADNNKNNQEATDSNQTKEKPNSDIVLNNIANSNNESNISNTNKVSNNDSSDSTVVTANNSSLNTSNTSTVNSANADATIAEDATIITSKWGTSPVTFDKDTGVLNVGSGTLINFYRDDNTYVDNNKLIEKKLVSTINFENDITLPNYSGQLFEGYSYLHTIKFPSKLDTANVTNMSAMFQHLSSLKNLNISHWNTSNVTDMSAMFYGCSALTSLDLNNWDTSNVTQMFAMFYGCSALTSLDLNNWDTSNVTVIFSMFNGCQKLSKITLGKNTKFVTNVTLPLIDTTSGEYTGRWIKEDNSSVAFTNSNEFMKKYNGTYPGTYVWEKAVAGKVTVNYVDENGKEIAPPTVLTGDVGDAYNTSAKKVNLYTLDDKKLPTNATGKFTDQAQTVIYVYKKDNDNNKPTPTPDDDNNKPTPTPDDDNNKPTPTPDDDNNKPTPTPDDDNNKPTPTPDGDKLSVNPNTKNNVEANKSELPQASSNNNIFTILAGMIASVLAIIGTFFKKNRE